MRNPSRDRTLGLHRRIPRRDFLNGLALGVGATLQRFFVMAPVTDPAQNRIAVIVNWPAALKR